MGGIGSKVKYTFFEVTQEQVTDLMKTLVPWAFWRIHQWDPQV